MEIFVGTAGWSNPIWNPGGLKWYQEKSQLNAVELTMSFYQLPTPMQVAEWAQVGKDLAWSVKVNRSVTQLFRFNHTAQEHFAHFRKLFQPLDHLISHYVFQLPPNMHPTMRKGIEAFFIDTGLGSRIALEWRNPKWFMEEQIEWASDLGICLVSADAPSIPRDILCINETVFLRLHGRSDWFLHHYSRKELGHIAQAIRDTGCKKLYAFLDNESAQLKNARAFFSILREDSRGVTE